MRSCTPKAKGWRIVHGINSNVAGLVAHPRVVQSAPFLQFIGVDYGSISFDSPADASFFPVEVPISGVRVRLTGEPGCVEVGVRASASTANDG